MDDTVQGRRRMRLRRCPLSHGRPSAICSLLPLPLVPARDGRGLRAERNDRSDRVTTLTGEPEMVLTPSASGRGQKIARCPNAASRALGF